MSDQRKRKGLLSLNPEPIKLVDASVRDVWTRSAYKPRCQHEDGRGQCTSRETTSRWRARVLCVESYCERHASDFDE